MLRTKEIKVDNKITYEVLKNLVEVLDKNDCPTGIVYAYLTKRAAKALGYTDFEEIGDGIGDGIVKVTIHNKRIPKNG